MTYKVDLTANFRKQFKKLDSFEGKQIISWLMKNIEDSENPRLKGKALVGNYAGKWRYRIGNYRVICLIDDDKLLVLALEVAHRKNIYGTKK